MRTYPYSTNWPEDLHEAHIFLIRAFSHIRQNGATQNVAAMQIINSAQLAVASELYPGYFKEVA